MAKPSFLKSAAIYGAGNLLTYAAGFLLLPLYVRCLSEGEYGTLDLFNRLGEVILLCLLYNGMRQALIAFHNQAEDEAGRRSAVGSALFLTAILLGMGTALTFALAEPLSTWLQAGDPVLLRLAITAVALESAALMLLALAQAREEAMFFACVNLGLFLTRVLLSLVLVAGFQMGIRGVLLAGAISSGGFAVLLLGRELCRGIPAVEWQQLRAMAWFALPFVPGGIGFFLLNSGDRFFLLGHVTREEIGAYALGYKLALVVKLFSRRPLYMVWSARMYEAARRPDAPEVFGKVFTRVLGAYVLVGLGLCLVQDEVIFFLAGQGYTSAASIIAPVTLAYFFLTAADLMDAAFYVQRRTAWKTPITLAGTGVTVGLYACLIPMFGIHGAAWATVLGFVFLAGLTLIVSQRVLLVRYEWGRVAGMLLLAIALWLIGRALPGEIWAFPARIGLWLCWPVLLWVCGLLNDEERAWLVSLAERGRNLLSRRRPDVPGTAVSFKGI